MHAAGGGGEGYGGGAGGANGGSKGGIGGGSAGMTAQPVTCETAVTLKPKKWEARTVVSESASRGDETDTWKERSSPDTP